MVAPTLTFGRRLRRRLWRIARALIIAYLIVLLIAMWLENRLIFHPFAYPAGEWQPAGLPFEDVWFQAADGTRLHGWYVPHPHAKAVVLFCHGNAGNVTHRAAALQMLHNHVGVAVLVFDYRGFGRSQGKPNGVNILTDARAARRWLANREKITESEVVLMGESIGGAVAVDLAAHDGARALVLESTFDSLPKVAAYHFPWLPVRWFMQTRLNSAELIGEYHGPLLQSHGNADTIVPLPFGRRLFDAANGPKHFVLLRGHDHNDPMPIQWYGQMARFLEEIRTSRAAAASRGD